MSGPSALPPLASVTKLSNYVTRILGQNPGKFTLQGTNTYLIHHPNSPSLILLDTAQGFPSYLTHLGTALAAHPVQPCVLTDIILSHYHHDHTEGLSSVVTELGRLGAVGPDGVRVWKFPCARDAGVDERDRDGEVDARVRAIAATGLIDARRDAGRDGEWFLVPGGQIRALEDRQRFEIRGAPDVEGEGDGDDHSVELSVVHTPGHTTDSISIELRARAKVDADDDASDPLGVFSFDTVLGHGTAVFSSLSTYLASLTTLIALLSTRRAPPTAEDGGDASDQGPPTEVPIYPGHGEVIRDGLAKVREYRHHRLERERQVVAALRSCGRAEPVTASSLTDSIYADTIPESLKLAATRGLLLHLDKLESDRVVSRHAPSEPGDGRGATRVDWASLGIAEKDVPRGWDDRWRWESGGQD